jgi:hypothetical protein
VLFGALMRILAVLILLAGFAIFSTDAHAYGYVRGEVYGTQTKLASSAALEWLQRAGVNFENISVEAVSRKLTPQLIGYSLDGLLSRPENLEYKVVVSNKTGSAVEFKVLISEPFKGDLYSREQVFVRDIDVVSNENEMAAAVMQVPKREMSYFTLVDTQSKLETLLKSLPRTSTIGKDTILKIESIGPKYPAAFRLTIYSSSSMAVRHAGILEFDHARPGQVYFAATQEEPDLTLRFSWDSTSKKPTLHLESQYEKLGSATISTMFDGIAVPTQVDILSPEDWLKKNGLMVDFDHRLKTLYMADGKPINIYITPRLGIPGTEWEARINLGTPRFLDRQRRQEASDEFYFANGVSVSKDRQSLNLKSSKTGQKIQITKTATGFTVMETIDGVTTKSQAGVRSCSAAIR